MKKQIGLLLLVVGIVTHPVHMQGSTASLALSCITGRYYFIGYTGIMLTTIAATLLIKQWYDIRCMQTQLHDRSAKILGTLPISSAGQLQGLVNDLLDIIFQDAKKDITMHDIDTLKRLSLIQCIKDNTEWNLTIFLPVCSPGNNKVKTVQVKYPLTLNKLPVTLPLFMTADQFINNIKKPAQKWVFPSFGNSYFYVNLHSKE